MAMNPACLTLACLAGTLVPAMAQARLSVALVGSAEDGDTQRLLALLRNVGFAPRLVHRVACGPLALRQADVVVVDWQEVERDAGLVPFGELERWNVPTVFLGDCGDVFARGWQLPNAREIAALPDDVRGPEMEAVRWPGDSTIEIWRQGHLFHFDSAPDVEVWSAADRDALARTVAFAARFVTDRPIVRFAAANGDPLPAAERERRQRIDDEAKLLGLDVRRAETLTRLPESWNGPALLHDLVADGAGAEKTAKDWLGWLRLRQGQLVWDELSCRWRVDPVAAARATPAGGLGTRVAGELRGEARADGAGRAPDAVALATKVVQHYGGRAFADLETFSCWDGDVCCQWDRRGGWFRIENHHVPLPGARVTPWDLAVLDTAADRDVLWGGGPPPRLRVSARQRFRTLLTRAFLPALLLDPGTSLFRRPEADAGEQRALVVRLAHRCLAANEFELLVIADTGEIVSVRDTTSPRGQVWQVVTTTACGPLRLPTTWRLDGMRRATEWSLDELIWNPELSTSIDTATERLTQPRER